MTTLVAPIASGEIIFDAAAWSAEQAARAFVDGVHHAAEQRGRGHVHLLQLPFADAVLRAYRRGGVIARLSRDWYWWRGSAATRPFREFRLTAAMHQEGLPVPRPLAARYVRSGLGYRAALITERIADARTLAECVQANAGIDWSAIGRMLAQFHARGLWHADLNAHNILIDKAGTHWLIDLDRGRLRSPNGAWRQGNIDRLQRSLIKLGALDRVDDFAASAWPALLAAYRST